MVGLNLRGQFSDVPEFDAELIVAGAVSAVLCADLLIAECFELCESFFESRRHFVSSVSSRTGITLQFSRRGNDLTSNHELRCPRSAATGCYTSSQALGHALFLIPSDFNTKSTFALFAVMYLSSS